MANKITTFLLNLIKVPTQIIYATLAIVLTMAFLAVFVTLSFLSAIWPLGALALAWYLWW